MNQWRHQSVVQVEGDTWGDKYKIASEARGSCWQLCKQEIRKGVAYQRESQSEQAYDVIKEKVGKGGKGWPLFSI